MNLSTDIHDLELDIIRAWGRARGIHSAAMRGKEKLDAATMIALGNCERDLISIQTMVQQMRVVLRPELPAAAE